MKIYITSETFNEDEHKIFAPIPFVLFVYEEDEYSTAFTIPITWMYWSFAVTFEFES